MPKPPRFDGAGPPVIFLMARPHVEATNVLPPLEALYKMEANTASVREYGGRVELVFEGYDDDPRELYEIEEVRVFVAELTAAFPYWFHFCSKVDSSLWVILRCLLPPAKVSNVDGLVYSGFDKGAWKGIATMLFASMNDLYKRHGLTAEERNRTTDQVSDYVRSFFV